MFQAALHRHRFSRPRGFEWLKLWTMGMLVTLMVGCQESPTDTGDVQTLDLAQIQRDSMEVDSLYRAARGNYQTRNLDSAWQHLRAADAMLATLPADHAGLMGCQVAYLQGMVAQARSRTTQAIQSFGACLRRSRTAIAPADQRRAQSIKASIALANQCSQLGMMDSATYYAYSAVLQLRLQAEPDPKISTIALTTLGVISQEQGDTNAQSVHHYVRADSCFRAVIAARLGTPDVALSSIGNGYLNLGDLHHNWGHREIAETNLGLAMQYYLRQGATAAEGMVACAKSLALLHRELGHGKEALRWFGIAYQQSDIAYPAAHRERGKVMLEEGRFWLSQGDGRRALSCFHRSLGQFLPSSSPKPEHQNPLVWELEREWYVTHAIAGKARAYALIRPNERLDSAFHCYIDAVRYADHLRRSFGTLEEKAHLAEAIHPVIESATAQAITAYQQSHERQYLEFAFELMERAKANDLLDALDQVDASGEYSLPDSTWSRGREIADRLDSLRRRIREGDAAAIRPLLALQDDSTALQEAVRKQFPGYFWEDSRYASWQEVREGYAGSDTLIVEYFRGKTQLYVMATCGVMDTALVIDWEDSLDQAIASLQRSLTDPDRVPLHPTYTDAAWLIYRKILQPVMALSPTPGIPPSRMVVVPDAQLSFIPFEALLTAPVAGKRVKPRKLPFLLRSTAVSYVPSLQLLLRLRRRAGQSGTSEIMGMGSNLPPEGYDGLVQPLYFAGKEVEFAVDRMGGEAFTNGAATEAAFKQHSPQYGLLHLSTHGILNDIAPLRSGILLHSDKAQDEDGTLHAYEVYQLRLRSRLAVLSACSVGKGKWIRGQGVMSVGRAFMVAGCNNVVMTLQDVDDRRAYEIMRHFYEALSAGVPATEALRQARLQYLDESDSEFSHPAYWSPFVLVGEGDCVFAAESDENTGRWALLAIAIAATTVLIVALGWKSVRRNQNRYKG